VVALLLSSQAIGFMEDDMRLNRRRSYSSERGQALLETALTLPIVLLVAVGIFEFGRAFQTWQILTNAAREGARIAVLPGSSVSDVQSRVVTYMHQGQLPSATTDMVVVDQSVTMPIGATATAAASVVTVNYPFSFVMLNPVARLLSSSATLGASPFTMVSSAQMRNEAQ
jgi:Flp pilus assembly protein TadG